MFYYFAAYEMYFSVFLTIDSLRNTLKEAQAMLMNHDSVDPTRDDGVCGPQFRQYDSSSHVLVPAIHPPTL